MRLAPCISEHERAQMERMEEASMHGYPRLGPPFNAYFQSYERAVYRLHTEGGELVAYAIADTSRPRLLVMRIHELHVEQAWRRQTHATRLVHAIEDGAPVNSSLEVHVQCPPDLRTEPPREDFSKGDETHETAQACQRICSVLAD
jgi:GNAT superfamily N-acetyltransferase